jgi:hypothetical protein
MTATHETAGLGPPRTMAPGDEPADPATGRRPIDDLPAVPAGAGTPVTPPRESGEEAIWRRAAIGAVLGFTLTVVVIASFARMAGLGTAAAVGIGAFAGMWSGVGFGFMMGGTPVLAAHARPSERAAAAPQPAGTGLTSTPPTDRTTTS